MYNTKRILKALNHISSEVATALLREGKPLLNCYIQGEIIIKTGEPWIRNVVIENCVIESFSACMVEFQQPVRLVNCNFNRCEFTFSYFFGGLIIDKCEFENYLDFQAGGYNEKGRLLILTNNTFELFVNFFDCWFNGEVVVSSNKFMKGTNLLGKPFDIPVTFDIEPTIKENSGRLDLNMEN